MNLTTRTRGIEGLARRLAARRLPEAEAALAGMAAAELRDSLDAALETHADLSGPPERPVVSIADPQAVARLTGSAAVEADPAVARAILSLRRRRR